MSLAVEKTPTLKKSAPVKIGGEAERRCGGAVAQTCSTGGSEGDMTPRAEELGAESKEERVLYPGAVFF